MSYIKIDKKLGVYEDAVYTALCLRYTTGEDKTLKWVVLTEDFYGKHKMHYGSETDAMKGFKSCVRSRIQF